MQNDFLTYQKGKIKYSMYIMHLLNTATCLMLINDVAASRNHKDQLPRLHRYKLGDTPSPLDLYNQLQTCPAQTTICCCATADNCMKSY